MASKGVAIVTDPCRQSLMPSLNVGTMRTGSGCQPFMPRVYVVMVREKCGSRVVAGVSFGAGAISV